MVKIILMRGAEKSDKVFDRFIDEIAWVELGSKIYGRSLIIPNDNLLFVCLPACLLINSFAIIRFPSLIVNIAMTVREEGPPKNLSMAL